MHSGYLFIETHPDHTGLIRFDVSQRAPQPPTGTRGGHIHYVASFNDADAAMMHVHEALRHHLVDIDNHLYKTDIVEAIAVVKSRILPHKERWIDSELDEETLRRIEQRAAAYQYRRCQLERLAVIVGRIAIALLAAQAVMTLMAF